MPNKGFIASLFDLSFSSLITTKIIKVLYVITLIVLALTFFVLVVAGFSEDPAVGALMLFIVAPVGFLFYAIWARVTMEIVMAVFRIMETNVEMLQIERQRSPLPATSSAPPAAPPAAS